MQARADGDITLLLSALRDRKQEVDPELLTSLYSQLRKLAQRQMRNERADHTLRATALVNEAYLKLIEGAVSFQDRTHFFAIASRVMRQIMVDYARSHRAAKRGGGAVKLDLTDFPLVQEEKSEDVLALDEVMARFAKFAPRQAQIVEMRFFGGMTAEEVAAHLNLSVRTVHRQWDSARAWLSRELKRK